MLREITNDEKTQVLVGFRLEMDVVYKNLKEGERSYRTEPLYCSKTGARLPDRQILVKREEDYYQLEDQKFKKGQEAEYYLQVLKKSLGRSNIIGYTVIAATATEVEEDQVVF